MRRTYRSKKDTGGGIDHKDMVLSMDAKSSVFDAYYIQNIKQVKREMSCVSSSNPYSAASNKVRKRKYVKRLKEPEPNQESLTDSAYLTPDKSIRVNKAPDLFDQLLLSSPMVSSPKTSTNVKNYSQKPKIHAKTYCRKKLIKVKKFDHSDSDASDSNKENSDESNFSCDKSNIIAHKLLIEPEQRPSSVDLDESINKIVQNLPMLSKLSKENGNETLNRSSRFSCIQFNATQSPVITNSPQCSTPFYEKHRGKSIYRFSPISKDVISSEVSLEHENEINDSTSCTDTDNIVLQKTDRSIKNSNTVERISAEVKDINENKETNNSTINNVEKYRNTNSFHTTTSNESVNEDQFLSNITCSLQLTECEPFFGFPRNSSTEGVETNHVNISRYKKVLAENSYVDDSIVSSVAEKQTDNNFIEHEKCSVSESTDCNSIIHVNVDVSNSFVSEDSESIQEACDDIEEASKDIEELSEDIKSASLYDTCDSDNLSVSLSDKSQNKEAMVLIERMSDSTLQKYIKEMASRSLNDVNTSNVSEDNEISSNIYESDYSNLEKSDNNILSKSMGDFPSDSNNLSHVKFAHSNKSSSEYDNSYASEMEDEEEYVSFVTTRRRVEISNNSFLFTLDDCNESVSSPSFNKTVLSNSKLEKSDNIGNETLVSEIIVDKNKTMEDIANIPVTTKRYTEELEDSINCTLNEDIASIETKINSQDDETLVRIGLDQHCFKDITDIDKRKSSIALRRGSIASSQMKTGEDLKHGIVLKPGKKWERSLSIYRRMTTMGDAFDQSILDDESLKTKGRKYRQSVISTMEMQEEYPGSLHNESVFSRRSTFVSKLRSTIKIIKDPNASCVSLNSSVLFDDLEGLLNGDCDDTLVELSKLSIGDSDHEVTVLDKFHDTSNRIFSARDYVLRRCNQTVPILFDECYPDPVLKNCRKIGEGVYGEVFLWRAGDGRARVMKIVPIAGDTKVNGEDQKGYHEIISEIVIAMELSALRAPIAEIERHFDEGKGIDALDLHSVQNATDVFNEVLAVRCVYGSYPSRLLDLWELYDETKGSENDNPAVLPTDQHYLVLELANAGQDLESYQFNNAEQAYALFKQIALGLAVAEEELQFEHRDLHWGNVLIAPTDQKVATFVIRGRLYRTARSGVAATLIDYSLSRACRGGRALYNDLSQDDALFDAVGDYQFQVYRLMRDKLGNDWKNYEPYTNILWLHYTVDKMITALRYTRTNTKIHKHYIAKLKEIKNRVLDYGSATQFVLTDNEF